MHRSSEQSPDSQCEAIADSLSRSGFPGDHVVEVYLVCLQIRSQEDTHRRATASVRRAVRVAEKTAVALRHGVLGPEHILLGLSEEGEGVAGRALQSLGLSSEELARKVEETVPVAAPERAHGLRLNPPTKHVLALSLRAAGRLGHDYVGTGHILLGLLAQDDSAGSRLVVVLGVEVERLRQKVLELLAELADQGPDARIPPVSSPPATDVEAKLEGLKDLLEDFEHLVRERRDDTDEDEPGQP